MRKNLKDMFDETKGLLLIDGAYNTILIPMGSDEIHELYEEFIRKNIRFARKNKTKSDLNRSIKEYLNKEYINIERED